MKKTFNQVMTRNGSQLKDGEESVWERWSSVGNEQISCPVPGCHHTADVLTKAHFKIEHNMSRDEAGELYGFPKRNIQNSYYRKKALQKAEREPGEVITYNINELVGKRGVLSDEIQSVL